MSNELSVLGFGQCGSKVAVEVSASFNPAKILQGDSVFDLAFKFATSRFRRLPVSHVDSSPAFYIADLNSQNDIYVYFHKAQQIYAVLQKQPNLKSDQIIEILNKRNYPNFIEKKDAQIIDEIRSKGDAFSIVQALHFEIRNKPMLEIGGAGGVQYISEAIADNDDNLLDSIDQRRGGALFGIFALGGGTGSGSLFSVLTRYRKRVHRYTVGVGVIPEQQQREQFLNAGRYFAKFLGAKPADRYNTLFLFSNEAATSVMIDQGFRDIEDPVEVINEYIGRFISDFSQINDKNTITKFGKHFDPMDGKRFLDGVCNLGFSESNDFSPKDLFCRAIGPLSLSDEGLNGVSVKITTGRNQKADQEKIKELISEIVEHVVEEKDTAENHFEELAKLTPFYRTIKSVHIFMFLRNSNDVPAAYEAQKMITEFFKRVSGDAVSVGINCYYTPESVQGKSSMLCIFNGAFSVEIYESVMKYAQSSFIDDSQADRDFVQDFNSLLIDVRRMEKMDAAGKIRDTIERILKRDDFRAAETSNSTELLDITNHPEIRKVISADKMEKILVNRASLERALNQIALDFTLGETAKPLGENVFSDF